MIYADNYGDADSAALLRLDASSIFALLRHTFAGLRVQWAAKYPWNNEFDSIKKCI